MKSFIIISWMCRRQATNRDDYYDKRFAKELTRLTLHTRIHYK